MTRVKGAKILTTTGDYFNFENFENSPIRITDIAHALSNVCRFGGHCHEFYSVAQHSVLVSLLVPEKHALQALLHDATEAYLGDMVKPLKDLIPQFQQIENDLESAIFRRFNLPEKMHHSIKKADSIMLATEQRDVMKNSDSWEWTYQTGRLKKRIRPMSPVDAKKYFMSRYEDLINGY